MEINVVSVGLQLAMVGFVTLALIKELKPELQPPTPKDNLQTPQPKKEIGFNQIKFTACAVGGFIFGISFINSGLPVALVAAICGILVASKAVDSFVNKQ